MTYKTDKLQSRIIEKFGTQAAFAEALGIDKSTLSKLINEGREWKGSKMMKAVEVLEIPAEEIDSYFFTPSVEELQP
jgi:plasmid maintenance system antidote protein VapI